MIRYRVNVGYPDEATRYEWVVSGVFDNEAHAISAAHELFRDFLKVYDYVQVRIEVIRE